MIDTNRAATSADSVPTVGVDGAARPLLEAKDLAAGYGSGPVLKGLNIAVYPGEVVALLGANGAGKTTTLHALAGELPLQGGSVRWLGKPIHSALHRRARRGLGLLTEERSVFMKLTVAENLRLGRGTTARALEEMPELRALLKRRAGLLSGGEQQILSLGRALAGDYKVLMIDEISLGLAPVIVQRLLRSIRAAAVERGLGVLLVEQHVGAALRIADRAIVLRRGEVALTGTSEELAGRLGEVRRVYL
jgi:branched-chain amino acid transport system ATP-binding protein